MESPDEEVLATEIKKLDGLSMALAHKLEEVRERKREIIDLSVHHLSEARLSKVAREPRDSITEHAYRRKDNGRDNGSHR